MTPLEQIRAFAMSHPDVQERLSHGEPTWFFRGKRSFAMFADHHHDDRVAVWCAAPAGIQEALVQSDPEQYFRPPYFGVRGWVGIYLDAAVDWEAAEEIVAEAYRMIAAKR